MNRTPVYAVLLVLLGGLVYLGGKSFDLSGCCPFESAEITDYVAVFEVDEGGDLHATERITVLFDPYYERHGIFRFFDHRDPNARFSRRQPHDIEVKRNGVDEPFEILSEDDGRYTNVRIGSPDQTVEGDHTYEIRYVVDDVLLPIDGGERSRFYWNLIPQGWTMNIANARLTVALPGPVSSEVDCHNRPVSRNGCTAEVRDDTVVVEVSEHRHHWPVTIATDLNVPTPPKEHRQLWPTALDGTFGKSNTGVLVSVLLGLVTALLGYRLRHRSRERRPSFPLRYRPPDGIGPAQAAYILRERTGPKAAFVATLMHAAEQGGATFAQDGEGWTIGPADDAGRRQLDSITRRVLGGLGATQHTFRAGSDRVGSGRILARTVEDMKDGTREWATREGLMTPDGYGRWKWPIVLVPAVLAAVIAFWNPFDAAIWAIVPGLFAVFAWEVLLPSSDTRRTPAGRTLWSKVGGFHRVLSTSSARARFDFASRENLYTTYLPWAVAFDCADEWAQKYQVEVGAEPPAPAYWAGSDGADVHTGGTYVAQMIDSFDDTVGSAISSYESTQSSSSGGSSSSSYTGGGGSVGGGGGGGGGGGSW